MINLTPEIGNNFCYAPWTNIHINPQGTYKTCCGGSVEIADLRVIPINEVYKSRELTSIKNKILSNSKDNNCTNCYRQEQMSSTSERNWYDSISDKKTIQLNDVNDSFIQNLDIRWSTTCNLSCTYCGPDASSQWASIQKVPIDRLDYSKTLDSIIAFIQNNENSLKNLGLLGGEPLLQKENNFLLDVISDNVHINVITNLSVPLESNRIFHKLLSKKNVVWDISFDTVEEKFEYVRRGASWETQLKNIRYLQDCVKDKQNHIIGTAGVYSIYNALELSNLHQYFENNNLPTFRWNELHHPSILSVISLPESFRLKAADELEKSIKYHSQPRQINFLRDMAQNLRNIKNNEVSCSPLKNWHIKQENTYWPDFKYKFADLWTEYRD